VKQRTAAANARGAGVLLQPGVIGAGAARVAAFPRSAGGAEIEDDRAGADRRVRALTVDLVPDFLLGLGQVDDVGAIGLALLVLTRLVPRLAPAEVVAEHRAAMGLGGGAFGAPGGDRDRTVVEATYRCAGRADGGAGPGA
jgi:hypothetical protein